MTEGYLLAVTNRFLCKEPFLERIKKIAEEEMADYLILREKDLPHKQYCSLAKECKELLQNSSVRLVLHSDLEAAWELSVDAIHLPFSVFQKEYLVLPEEKKKLFSLIGVSVHSVEEAVFVERNGGSYVMAGHIFATDCKKGLPPRGILFLKKICESVSIPVYAVGGMDLERVPLVLKAGASGAAIMSGFMRTK